MKHIILLVLILSIFSCKDQQTQQLPESPVIAVVGEEAITADLLKAFLQANGIVNADETIVNRAMDKLVEEMAMANIAKKEKLTLTGAQLNTLKYLNIKSLASVAKQDYLQANQISEDEIKKEYENANKQVGGIQFHVRHVLFKDEVQAIKELEKIKSADDYFNYEAQYIKNTPNTGKIGDIGWVTLGELPESFREVIPGLADNTVLPDVVNSRFGAHIVFLQGTRKLQPPKFEEVKAGIINSLKAKRLSKFSQLAKAKAHVIIKEK